MKKTCLKKYSAFTLIELLVVISIIGILFTVGLALYNDFNRRQIVTQAAKELKDNLRLAQSKALAGEKPADCGTASLSGHKLKFTDAQNYKIVAVCGGSEIDVKTGLSLGVNVSKIFGPDILFKVLGQGVEISAEEKICISGFNKIYRLKITPSGEIKDEGFQSSC